MSSVEQQVKDAYSLLSKLKEEISEYTDTKTNLVRDINLKLLEANSQATKIIEDAKIVAKGLTEEGNNAKREGIDFKVKTEGEAGELLHIAKEGVKEVQEEKVRLEKQGAEFMNLKNAFFANSKKKEEDLAVLVKDLNNKEAHLLDQSHNINLREIKVNERELKANEKNGELSIKENTLSVAQDRLNQEVELHNIEKSKIEEQRITNERDLLIINEAKLKVEEIEKSNLLAIEEINQGRLDIANRNKVLTEQFALLEATSKQIESDKLALKEQEQLIALRNQEVLDNIRVLEELRANQK